jgi:hypothetical protein
VNAPEVSDAARDGEAFAQQPPPDLPCAINFKLSCDDGLDLRPQGRIRSARAQSRAAGRLGRDWTGSHIGSVFMTFIIRA